MKMSHDGYILKNLHHSVRIILLFKWEKNWHCELFYKLQQSLQFTLNNFSVSRYQHFVSMVKAADSFALYCSLEYLDNLYLRHWMGICWTFGPGATMLHWENHGQSLELYSARLPYYLWSQHCRWHSRRNLASPLKRKSSKFLSTHETVPCAFLIELSQLKITFLQFNSYQSTRCHTLEDGNSKNILRL
jgi:hypothetical protein